jgi:hypothetical protein
MTHYPVPIPEDLLDERVLPIQVVAKIVSQSPKKTLGARPHCYFLGRKLPDGWELKRYKGRALDW